MSRSLLVLIALLLPLQLAWASVSAYCGDRHDLASSVHLHLHEHGHEHEHDGDHAADADAGSSTERDGDHCHGHGTALPLRWSALQALAASQQAEPLPPPRVSALSPPRPERPQWLTLA